MRNPLPVLFLVSFAGLVSGCTDTGPMEAEPPVLFGQHFHLNPVAGIWALHVWLWKHNPSGMFDDWNPNVTCDYAD